MNKYCNIVKKFEYFKKGIKDSSNQSILKKSVSFEIGKNQNWSKPFKNNNIDHSESNISNRYKRNLIVRKKLVSPKQTENDAYLVSILRSLMRS